ncbi:ABC transporter permease [Cecembia rubra]|uniref:FtsX-like permease family protein n=1 Tax=Cecembia rubra TaxID=1485585 RepID=A0A2P8EE47_9BACT|nr:FtsX-like permease family protein [Cecembia rubra]PSL07704.1 FtsX-like permease family protein [Cecembia rubra]
MFSNYFKIAVRGFAKNKLTFFINLFGLALGLWATISIGIWVKSELNMNQSFPEIDQVYRIMEHQRYGSDIFTTNSTPGILAPSLKEEFPEVERSACYSWNEKLLFVVGDSRLILDGFYAEPDFLHILQYKFLHGKMDLALTEPNHIVLTEDAAIKLFGKSDVVGETVTLKESEGESPFQVIAVVERNSHEVSNTFEYILPYQFMFDKPYNSWLKQWGNNGPSTIVKLHKGSDGNEFSSKIEDFIVQKNKGSNVKLFAYPQKDLYLYGSFKDGLQQGGRIEYVRLFSIIGIFVLLIACINFMNLSTAKSQKRSKEVGVRKVVGAEKKELIFQFLTESILISFVAGALALILVELTLPIFNNLTGKAMLVPYFDWLFWIQYLIVLLITGIVAGSYPAFYLSATRVVSVFRNFTKSGKGVVVARKGLVLFQFILATMLILATIVVFKQINFALTKDLGYNKDQLLTVQLEGRLFYNFDIFKEELKKLPQVQSVTRSTHSLLGRNSNTGAISWEGKDPDFTALFEIIRVDYDFLETMGIKLVQGEDYSIERASDSLAKVLINRRAYDLISQNTPNPASLTWNEDLQILGVVEDFHFQSFHQGMEPAVILLDPSFATRAYIKVSPESMRATLEEIKKTAEAFEPLFPFQFSFMDDSYARLYEEDIRTRELAKYFSILTILISCLGLFGLSAHIAEQKTKEIGIRKVLGASALSILHVINKEFILIVSISVSIGSAIAYWLIQDWLNGYAYRIDFEWWFIPLAAGVIFSIAYLTVSLQAYKASMINPVSTLKSE